MDQIHFYSSQLHHFKQTMTKKVYFPGSKEWYYRIVDVELWIDFYNNIINPNMMRISCFSYN
ncbi:hypothetical protein BpHYR1_039516 [Brachionus plicatilis]|uniref:Uncharacterized protein n=1 Tax=Brachionus plicatilis TaxID=10195 RepID=A0A3M7R2L5_BRAPC|nr:hypothetical protein BpHYR1_039516 [Brachionus plicatilis]